MWWNIFYACPYFCFLRKFKFSFNAWLWNVLIFCCCVGVHKSYNEFYYADVIVKFEVNVRVQYFMGVMGGSLIIILGNLQWKSPKCFSSGFHCLPFHFTVTDTERWQRKHPVGAIRIPFSIQPVLPCYLHNKGNLDISRNHCEVNWAEKASISFACFNLSYNDRGRSRLPVLQ